MIIDKFPKGMTIPWAKTSAAGPWQAWRAWRPVKDIHGSWHWLSRIYRRQKNRMVYPNQGWEYGTAFDVIRDA